MSIRLGNMDTVEYLILRTKYPRMPLVSVRLGNMDTVEYLNPKDQVSQDAPSEGN